MGRHDRTGPEGTEYIEEDHSKQCMFLNFCINSNLVFRFYEKLLRVSEVLTKQWFCLTIRLLLADFQPASLTGTLNSELLLSKTGCQPTLKAIARRDRLIFIVKATATSTIWDLNWHKPRFPVVPNFHAHPCSYDSFTCLKATLHVEF